MWNDSIAETLRRCTCSCIEYLSAIGLGCHNLTSIEDRQAAIAVLIDNIKYPPSEQRRLLPLKKWLT